MNKFLALASIVLIGSAVNGHEQVVNEWEPITLDDETFSKLVVDIHDGKGGVVSDKAWFIKFYAPWCGHCQRLAPTWAEFGKLHEGDLNVAKVDCTTDGGKPLCSAMEVRGYPSLLFFPGKNDIPEGEKAKAIKYTGGRVIEEFEKFAFAGGWKSVGEDNFIPFNTDAVEKWGRWAAQQKTGLMKEIDAAWGKLGFYQYVPAPYHYYAVTTLCVLPFIFMITILCCLFEDDTPTKTVYKQDGTTSPKKVANKPEKLE